MSKLEQLLKKQHLTKAEACRRTGISPSVMSRVCKGERNPSPIVARQLADLLGVPPDAFGCRGLRVAPGAQAALETARKRIEAFEKEVSELASAAMLIIELLDVAQTTLGTAKTHLRRALSRSNDTQ